MFIREHLLDSAEFSWHRALNCALASQLAYSEAVEVENETSKWGFERSVFFSIGATQGFVAWDSEIVLVSFRGTQQLGDWLVNLNVARSKNPPEYGKVHSGFYGSFKAIEDQLVSLLNDAGVEGKKLWVTGHSLGGALATMMAADLLDTFSIDGVYTFGQPRAVGRRTRQLFRTHYKNRFFRIVNDDDVVPKIPPLLKHVGTILWFDKDGSMKEAPPGVRSDEFGPEEMTESEFEAEKERIEQYRQKINEFHNETVSRSLEEIEPGAVEDSEDVRGFLPSIRDHSMLRYIQRIQVKTVDV